MLMNELAEQLAKLPAELLTGKNFVGYDKEKRPINPHTGGLAAVDDPSSWGSIQDALDLVEAGKAIGVGRVFTEGDPYSGIDTDKCIENGKPEPWAADLINRFDSYTEISPGGGGYHIWVKGRLRGAGGRRKGKIEVYSSGRYFTLTGNRVPGTPEDVNERQAELDALIAELDAGKNKNAKSLDITHSSAGELDDEQIIQLAQRAVNGDKFSRLWAGDHSGYSSASEADIALANMLAFWTGRDNGAVDRLFRQSGLYRDKWDKKHSHDGRTYGQMTVDKAIELTTEVYEPSQPGTIIHHGAVIGLPPLADEFFEQAQRVPELPPDALISPDLADEGSPWLDAYIRFSRNESPASYDEYHTPVGLYVLSSLAAGRIAYQPNVTTTIIPNLFILLGGTSTIYRKSSATNVGRFLLHQLGKGHLIYPHVSTAENLIKIMQAPRFLDDDYDHMTSEEREEFRIQAAWAHVKAIYLDEAGQRLVSITNRRGIYHALYSLLLQAARGEEIGQDTISRGRESVQNGYMTLLGNLTPATLQHGLGGEDSALWSDGFLARFGIVCPPVDERPKHARWKLTEHIPNDVIQPLAEWDKRLGQPDISISEEQDEEGEGTGRYRCEITRPPVQMMKLSPEAEDAFYRYNAALSDIIFEQSQEGTFPLAASYANFPMTAIRISLLLASVAGHSIVGLNHWARAQQITERWREGLHNLYEQVSSPAADPTSTKLEKVFRVVQDEWSKSKGQAISVGYITRRLRTLPKTEVMDLLAALQIRRMLTLERGKADNGRETTFIAPYTADGE